MIDLVFIRWSTLPVLSALGLIVISQPIYADSIAEGATIATAGGDGVIACSTCHGAKGEGMAAAGFPYLAGQGQGYLAEQLHHFAQGARRNPVMEPIAKALSPTQIKAVAAYYSQLPQVFDSKTLSERVDTYPPKDAVGSWLANRGDWNNNIPACIQCHGPGGVGVGEQFPALAGLPAPYLRAQLMSWKAGTRPDGPLALMGDIARRMSDAQINAVSDHFAELSDTAAGKASSSAPEGAQ